MGVVLAVVLEDAPEAVVAARQKPCCGGDPGLRGSGALHFSLNPDFRGGLSLNAGEPAMIFVQRRSLIVF